MARPVISSPTKGHAQPDEPGDVLLAFYGSRGGSRGYANITRETAVALRDRLNEILSEEQ